MDGDSVAEEYKSSLADLNYNSKPHINMLTMLAEENIKHAPKIVQEIINYIHKVPPERKLPYLYLVDSIIKNVGKQYLSLFSQNMVSLFTAVFEKVDENTRSLLYKLRQTWNDFMPNKILYALDDKVKKIDPAWPITAKPPAQSIHINPKFLGANTQNASSPQPILKKQEDKFKQQQGEVLKQLLVKQEQLKLLEQKKLEIARMQKLVETSTPRVTLNMKSSIPDPRATLKANQLSANQRDPRINQRDPRLLKINISTPKATQKVGPVEVSATLMPNAATLPSIAVVPNNKSLTEKGSPIPKENVNSPEKYLASKTIKTPNEIKELSLLDKIPDKIKNAKLVTGKSKSNINKAKINDESKKKTCEDKKTECEKVSKVTKNSKEKEKSPKSSKKKETPSPENKVKIAHNSRNLKPDSSPKKQLFRSRSRSPLERSKNDKESHVANNQRSKISEKKFEESQPGVDTDLRLQSSNDSVSRNKAIKRDSKTIENESAEKAHLPQEKKLRGEISEETDKKINEPRSLFGNKDQDYRQHNKERKAPTQKGWAQYKATHPDEFKSPLRPLRENLQGKPRFRKFQRPDSPSDFYPLEYDRLGRSRMPRGRFGTRFSGRPGPYMRPPIGRYESMHPLDEQYNENYASMMLSDPHIILQRAETKYRLGRLSEVEYLDLRRDLQKMLESKDHWQLMQQKYAFEHDEIFRYNERPFREGLPHMLNEMEEDSHFIPNIPIQGPMKPPSSKRSFQLDGKLRTIHFVDEKAIALMDNNEPRELMFKGDPRKIYIEGLSKPITLGFDGQSSEFEINGRRHNIKFGTPSRELYIDNHPYEIKFGGPPIAAMLEKGLVCRIRLEGPPPQVIVGEIPQYELLNKYYNKDNSTHFTTSSELSSKESEIKKPNPACNINPYDVDMRIASKEMRHSPVSFNSNAAMKDVDMRHIPLSQDMNRIPLHSESWKESNREFETRDYNEQNQQDKAQWHNHSSYFSEPCPQVSKWDNPLLPPPIPPLHLTESSKSTPPHQIKWEHTSSQNYEERDRLNWREKEYNHEHIPISETSIEQPTLYDRRDTPQTQDKPSEFYDNSSNIRSTLPPPPRPPFNEHQMRSQIPLPHYGSWVSNPSTSESLPVSQLSASQSLLPPPLPPFQMKTNMPSQPTTLLPPPKFPGLESTTETLSLPPPNVISTTPSHKENQPSISLTNTVTTVQSSLSTVYPSSTVQPLPTTIQSLIAPQPVISQVQPIEPVSQPSIATSFSIDVKTLFQKLVAAGIINSKPCEQPGEDKPLDKTNEDKRKEESPDDEPIPPIDFKSESLRARYPGVIALLNKGSQCASCGVRFKEIQSEHYSRHLDWHFRKNRREKDSVKKAFSRRWYYEVEEWLQFEEFEDSEERAPSYFELQADGGQMQDPEPVQLPSVPAIGQETEICVVCNEPFQLYWVEDEEEWHLRNAVRHDEQAYHPACYEDYKKSLETPEETGEDLVTDIKENFDDNKEQSTTLESELVSSEEKMDTEEVKIKQEIKDEVEEEVENQSSPSKIEENEMTEITIKEEPMEEILEGKPGEEEVIGLISESDIESEADVPKCESKMVVMESGGIIMKVKAESIQPQSPSVPNTSEKDSQANETIEESEEEEFRPPTPDPRFQVMPPVKKGTELSGLCCIM